MKKPKVYDVKPPNGKPTGAGKGDKWRSTNWEAYRASPFWEKRDKRKEEEKTQTTDEE